MAPRRYDTTGALPSPPRSGRVLRIAASEAEQWIDEYNEAMSKVPEESDN